MLLEMHCHSSKHSSCSQIDPVSLVKSIVAKKLQGLVITEHSYLWAKEELMDLRREAEVDNSFIILAGQEAETDVGHVRVFGADKSITGNIKLADLKKLYPEAALVWSHPFRSGKVPTKEELLNPLFDAVEIFNSNQTIKENYLGLAAWHKYKFAAIGGTDTHSDAVAGSFPTQFDHPIENVNDLIREIKAARCRPFFKEIPKAGTNIIVTEITFGTKSEDETRDRVILKKFTDDGKWNKSRETLKIVKLLDEKNFNSKLFRVPKIIDVNESEKLIIEEGQRGSKLFDLLIQVKPEVGVRYFNMSAEWLAKFHNSGIVPFDAADPGRKEAKRFRSYAKAFEESGSPYLKEAEEVIGLIEKKEQGFFSKERQGFVLNHGDYHPKNIIIGQDKWQDITTLFISVIDFDNAMFFHRAFDVGYFLAQFENQFAQYPAITKNYKEKDFINAYMRNSENLEENFLKHVDFFKIRANLSIASFLIRVGKGESIEMKNIMSKCMAYVRNR
ncbi:MAG: phosphotransferase [Candidatus Omnitrophica bacterium]|nr:phosphotransferase [Candidatus Omnitrophota bacterium]